uniref:CSON008157 protein n=1 Tax=Culicoides sonorensis TaxID=179676 RepID=A0A336MWB5_CULSO
MSPYDPLKNREILHSTSTFGALAHMIKACLGAGLFAMPMAIKYCGLVLGSINTIIIAGLCAHGMHLLVKTSRLMCVRTKQPKMNYMETTATTFETAKSDKIKSLSRPMEIFVTIALIGCYYGISCVYIVLMASSLKQEFDAYIGTTDVRLYILMLAIPLILIGQIRALKFLMPFSTLGNLLLFCCCIIILWDIFTGELNFNQNLVPTKFNHIPLYISIVVFAMEPIGVTLVIENEMENPKDFTNPFGVLNIACAIIGILYTSIGVLGYARYGDETNPSVTLNLPQGSGISIAVQIMIIISVYFSFGLNFYVASDAVWSLVNEMSSFLESIVRFWIVAACIGLAILIPEIGSFIGLVGALFLSTLGFILPALLDIVASWPDGLGKFKWILFKDIFLMMFGLVALISGTIASIHDIIDLYKKN